MFQKFQILMKKLIRKQKLYFSISTVTRIFYRIGLSIMFFTINFVLYNIFPFYDKKIKKIYTSYLPSVKNFFFPLTDLILLDRISQ